MIHSVLQLFRHILYIAKAEFRISDIAPTKGLSRLSGDFSSV